MDCITLLSPDIEKGPTTPKFQLSDTSRLIKFVKSGTLFAIPTEFPNLLKSFRDTEYVSQVFGTLGSSQLASSASG